MLCSGTRHELIPDYDPYLPKIVVGGPLDAICGILAFKIGGSPRSFCHLQIAFDSATSRTNCS